MPDSEQEFLTAGMRRRLSRIPAKLGSACLDALPRIYLPASTSEWHRRLGAQIVSVAEDELGNHRNGPRFTELKSLVDFQQYRSRMRKVHERRALLEAALASSQAAFTYPGFDACVSREAEFLVDYVCGSTAGPGGLRIPNYRERLISSRTGMNCRQRATFLALSQAERRRDLADLAVYATEQTTDFFRFLKRKAPHAVGSEFLGPDAAPGATIQGIRHEDVTRLSFRDRAFDLVISNDVLEHVPDYRTACREFYRVLREGGRLVVTVPFMVHEYDHVIRARLGPKGNVEHLLPPEYHGDPLHPEHGILCFQWFGWRLLDDFAEAGFVDSAALLTWSYFHGILGGDQLVLHARKGAP